MISSVTIIIKIDGESKNAHLICDSSAISITFMMENTIRKTYEDSDFFRCFGLVRKDNPHIQFLCKGAKINVHPSSMSTQMSLGIKAYELTLGKVPSLGDVINIFDYDDVNLTNDPDEQRAFFKKWREHEKTD